MGVRKFKTLVEWKKAVEKEGADLLNGPSRGGAAARLGVSRQYIHKLVHGDRLDVIVIESPPIEMVSEKSLRAVVDKRHLEVY